MSTETSKKNLVNEHFIYFSPSLAVELGVNAAVLLERIHYWTNKQSNIAENHSWVYRAYPDWAEELPWLQMSGIRKILTNLKKQGIIITGTFNKRKYDKTLWYRINYEHPIFTIDRVKKAPITPKSLQEEIENLKEYADNHPDSKTYLCGFSYQDFLKTAYWKTIAKYIRYLRGNICSSCGATRRLHVHHTTYEHHGDEINHLEDLIVLCKNCHKKIHGIEESVV